MKTDFCLGLSEEGFHQIAYTEWGMESSQPPIICLHGLTRNSRDFDTLATRLSYLGRHVFCPDLVGRGESSWLKNPLHYSFEQYMADMNAMIVRTGAKQVDWVGTSLGGLIGMFLAAMPNTPIRRLILNDVGAQISSKGVMRLANFAGLDPSFRSIEEAKNYYKRVMTEVGELTDEDWQRIAENSVREVTPGKFISKTDPNIRMSHAKSKVAWQAIMHPLKTLEGSLFDMDWWNIWRKVTCPTLIMHGEKSDILLPSVIQKMRVIHPATEVITISNVGHAPALIHPEQHETIYNWLQS